MAGEKGVAHNNKTKYTSWAERRRKRIGKGLGSREATRGKQWGQEGTLTILLATFMPPFKKWHVASFHIHGTPEVHVIPNIVLRIVVLHVTTSLHKFYAGVWFEIPI